MSAEPPRTSSSDHRRNRLAALPILHLDEHLVAVDKPAGLLSVPGRGAAPSVVELLRRDPRLADNAAARVVHRIDREASGVLLLARTLAAQQDLVRQFMRRTVHKTYVALVSGFVASDGEVDLPLLFDPRRQRVRAVASRGKPALTRYRVVQRVAGGTVLECEPVTGRTHQIRVHLAAIGHPLLVDPIYGSGEGVFLSTYKPGYRTSKRHDERPLIDRLTLHAARLRCTHPATGEPLELTAPLPKDLRATLTQLGRLV